MAFLGIHHSNVTTSRHSLEANIELIAPSFLETTKAKRASAGPILSISNRPST